MGFISVPVIPPPPLPTSSQALEKSVRLEPEGGLEAFKQNLTESLRVVKWKEEKLRVKN
jgi:hypothetical protein